MNSVFSQILGNNLVANITNFTVWFAVTFWVFLETHSVFATGMIAGIFLVFTAGFGFWFGSLVDHHSKKHAVTSQAPTARTIERCPRSFAGAPEPDLEQSCPRSRVALPEGLTVGARKGAPAPPS